MAKRGPKPKGKVAIAVETAGFWYAIGLLVTDGSVSKNGRHITFVSNDKEQIVNFLTALKINVQVSHTKSGYTGNLTPRIQFGDRLFCDFLLSIGITSNKTKTIGAVDVPDDFFFDFLRGHLDGDGTVYSYWDSRWKSSFMFYTSFVSASKQHILWIQRSIRRLVKIEGHISKSERGAVYQLRYAKADSLLLWKKLYPYPQIIHLTRKRLKIEKIKAIIAERQGDSKDKS
jgi:hypothetical protein